MLELEVSLRVLARGLFDAGPGICDNERRLGLLEGNGEIGSESLPFAGSDAFVGDGRYSMAD